MKITCPKNCLELLKKCAEEREPTGEGSFPNAFYFTLEVVPEFARDPKIHALLLDALQTEPLGMRMRASIILLKIGDPLGILNLTYNSLINHPILNIPNMCSGWTNAYLLHHLDNLTDECIDLLIHELHLPLGLWHANILSALPAAKIVPRMRELLRGADEYSAIAASYVLAMKRNDEGRAILENLIESQKLIDFALIALSHIPDETTMRYLRAYADPAHPIYSPRLENRYRDKIEHLRDGLMLHAQCRLFLLECRDPYPVRRSMERFYLHSIHDLIANDRNRAGLSQELSGGKKKYMKDAYWDHLVEIASRWIKPPDDFDTRFFAINSRYASYGSMVTAASAPDFLCEFAVPEDLAWCAEIQRNSIRALLEVIDWSSLGDGSDMGVDPKFLSWLVLPPTGTELGTRHNKIYVPGLKIGYEREDYERAAVDWILNPRSYCFNSYWPSFIIQ